ncbi:hypothetical protein [Caenimonas koreensis]|uniref:hypothetical protein n=1 Tax=Caenimonas koreensis TaxID=367474 RepID=UPI003782D89A
MHRLVLILVAWLLTAAAIAQPVAPAPAAPPVTVDTRAECLALGGAWLASRQSWMAVCQVPWGRDDCFHLGGGWTPNSAISAGGFCTAQISERATARQCTDSGGTWGPPGSTMPYCQPNTVRAKPPVKKASDANRACDGQADCIYGCIYKGPPVVIGARVQGVCRATNQVEGCDAMVESARYVGSICKR